MSQAAIANQIESHIGHLIEDWTAAVREDPRIQSDENLTKPELIDHVPAILEEICELIRKREIPGVRNSLEARANVYVRFKVTQGVIWFGSYRYCESLSLTI